MKSDKKIDDFEILAPVTSKMTSKPQQPRRPQKEPSEYFQQLHF